MKNKSKYTIKLGIDLGTTTSLIANAFYPQNELILRELIHNANDSLILRVASEPKFESQGRITIVLDSAGGRISVSDNGIGMTADQLKLAFGTIGSSSKRFLEAASRSDGKAARELVGQFGMGLLSTFIVADELEIHSSPIQGLKAFNAHTQSDGTWTISPASGLEPGTTVSLRLNNEGKSLLNRQTIVETIQHYCQLVSFPIYFHDEKAPIYPGRQLHRSIKQESDLRGQVAKVLSREGLAFEIEPSIGGLCPDFLVHGPNDRLVVVETKQWSSDLGFFSRALDQATYYQQVTGADSAFVVLADIGNQSPGSGVVDLDGLIRAIRNEFSKQKQSSCHKPISRRRPIVFAAMPFSKTYDDVYFVAMAHAAERIDASCVRVDLEDFSGDIVNEIHSLINDSIAVIADLSESKPNVLYEVGFAHALKKPVAHICSTPLDHLPFDVRNWSTIKYELGQTFNFRDKLADRLKSII